MEIIVQVLMLLICVVASLKLSHAPRWYAWLYALSTAAFVVMLGDWTSEQPQGLMRSYIEDKALRENIAILVTLESLVFVLFTFMSLSRDRQMSFWQMYLRKLARVSLTFYPSFLVFPILLYLQSNLFISMPGYDFDMISWLMGLCVFLLFALCPLLFRYLLPQKDLRLEILFLASIFIFIFGLITTVDDKMQYKAPEYNFPWQGLGLALLLLSVCMLIGFMLPYFKRIISKTNE